MCAVWLYLRRSYIIAVARVFYVNKFQKQCRLAKCHRVFQKSQKTHAQI